jgi:hypothetical protein
VTEHNLPAGDLGWLPSAPATGFLLDRGQIERIEPNPAHASTILAQARMHLSSARILATTEDAAAAFVTAYDAARKSLSAMLAVQGLRARGGDGGHRVLSELMQAQLRCTGASCANLTGCARSATTPSTQTPISRPPQQTMSPMASPPRNGSLSWGTSSSTSSPLSARQGRSLESGGRCLPVSASLSSVPCPHQALLWLNADVPGTDSPAARGTTSRHL